MPKYPNITVKPKDGNSFSILGAVYVALQEAKVSEEEILQFRKEATSGDYNHLLITVMETVNLEMEDDDDDCGYNQDDDLPECEDDE